MDAHTLRMLLVARSRLVSQRQATANTIRGLLKTFGLVVVKGSKGLFPGRVREQIAGNPALTAIIEPLLAVWYAIRDQVTMLDRQMLARTRNDQVARRLMTIPGVGVVIALAYTAVIDDPARFRRSVSVGAYLGLTPGATSPVRSTPLGTSRNAGTACYADISTKPPQCSSIEMAAPQS
jgi:transposase